MLHICKGAYLQLVIKCYILYKSTTLRKSEIRKKHYKRVKKNIGKEKNSHILSLVTPPTNPLDSPKTPNKEE